MSGGAARRSGGWSRSPLVSDAARRPRHLVYAVQDIGDRKRVEADLRESEERYRLVVQATRHVAWDWDLVTNRVVWGEALESLLGHSPPGSVTSADWWYEHIHAQDRERVVAGIQGALEHGASAPGTRSIASAGATGATPGSPRGATS